MTEKSPQQSSSLKATPVKINTSRSLNQEEIKQKLNESNSERVHERKRYSILEKNKDNLKISEDTVKNQAFSHHIYSRPS
jgi:hypothetical protein